MIDETLRKLEERIRSSQRTGDDAKQDLLGIVGELRTELAEISETHGDDARSLAGHAAAAADGTPNTVEDSVLEFEAAHPRIVGLVRSFLRTLSDAGI